MKKPIPRQSSVPIILIALVIAFTPLLVRNTGGAASATASTCRVRVVDELTKVHDEYRAVVFGSRKDLDANADQPNQFTVLTGGKSKEAHTGILETKERLTSELVAPLVESYRVLRCRSLTVCEAMLESLQTKGGDATIHPLGCSLQTVKRYDECALAVGATSSAGNAGEGRLEDTAQLQAYCEQIVADTLTFEQAALRLSVAYDAGYRSMLQLAGMMDWMQQDIALSTLEPIRNMVGLLGKLHQIPCFAGQCDVPFHPPF